MRKYTAVYAIILGCICAASLTGCESENVNYDVGEETESAFHAGDDGKRGLEQFKDEEWSSDLVVEVGKQKNRLKIGIDAKITIPDAKQMFVVEAKEAEFDAAYKEKFAKGIFEGEEIYYNDISHLSKAALEELYERYQHGYGDFHSAEQEEEQLAACEAAMETARDTDEYILADEYSVNEYLGTFQGTAYELKFTERTNERDADMMIARRKKEISFVPKDLHTVCPTALKECQYVSCFPGTRSVEENACRFSEEEARKMAEERIDSLGLDYPAFSHTSPLIWGFSEDGPDLPMVYTGYYGEAYVNGYVFYFDFGVDDTSVVQYGTEESYADMSLKKKESGEMRYSMYARLRIYVTDCGIIQMNAYNPLETVSVSQDVGLLPMDAVYKAFLDQLETQAGKLRFNFTNFNEELVLDALDLIYFRVRDKENDKVYSYVPTWRLGAPYNLEDRQEMWREEEPFLPNVSNPVFVNAIDGSMINLYEEM